MGVALEQATPADYLGEEEGGTPLGIPPPLEGT